jgi:uncharacterized protein
MVRVLVIADEEAPDLHHQVLRAITPDLVLSAGDLPWHYVEYVVSSVDAPAVFVPGNHDPSIERARLGRNGTYTADGLPCDGPRPHGAVNADGLIVEAAGLRIAGLGGCVRYKPGPHQYTQRQYVGRARRLIRHARAVGAIDVVLSHAPPLGLGDGTTSRTRGSKRCTTCWSGWSRHGICTAISTLTANACPTAGSVRRPSAT